MAERQWSFTPPGANYPPYLNVTELADHTYRVTVRSPATPDGRCGETSAITLSAEDFLPWLKGLHGSVIQ